MGMGGNGNGNSPSRTPLVVQRAVCTQEIEASGVCVCVVCSGGRSVTPTAAPVPPPYSNDRTSVWYWALDGVQTTVMFNKLTMEVWCNGRTLQSTVVRIICCLSIITLLILI